MRHDLFPLPIYEFENEQAKEQQKTLVDLFKNVESQIEMKNYYSMGGYTSYGSIQHILEYDELEPIKKFIQEKINTVLEDLNLIGYANFSGSWFNINRKNSIHESHNHIPDTLSGIYYVQADVNDAKIHFIDNNKISNWPWRSSNNNLTKHDIGFEPHTGKLYIFPSYAQHYVAQQTNDNERVSISFNTFLS
jgi:uncharacterized protein (TIGR02466 family)